jgi:hypothetical protein
MVLNLSWVVLLSLLNEPRNEELLGEVIFAFFSIYVYSPVFLEEQISNSGSSNDVTND